MNKLVGRGVLVLVAIGLLQAPQAAVAQSEGIKVHGRWTIDVREPGGALVSHREFENALTVTGATTLAQLLARQSVPGLWRIALMNTTIPSSPCAAPNGSFTHCFIAEANDPFAPGRSHFFTNLSISTLSAAGTFVLTGTATAAQASQIAAVGTGLGTCPAVGAPQPCLVFGDSTSFTSKVVSDPVTHLPAPIPVTAGQIIQVTVVISFQ